MVKSTIVNYYVWLRFPLLHPILRLFWLTHFIPKVIYYYFLDKTSRTKFNMGSISQQVTLTEIALRIYRCRSVSIMRSPSILSKALRHIALESRWDIQDWTLRVDS